MTLEQLFRLGMKRYILPLEDPLPGTGPILNLGAGRSELKWPRAWAHRVVDLDRPAWDADIDGLGMYEDSSVAGIFAFHFLEHLVSPISFLRECERVLMPFAPMTIVVPYYSAALASQDLTHQHFFTEETWKTLFNNQYYDDVSVYNAGPWRFSIGTNVIVGIVERNLSLFTQLIRAQN
jgi:hypothetical protein